MTTPPNRPQIQRPSLEDCRSAEKILRGRAIDEARRGGFGAAIGTAIDRYDALSLVGVITRADAEELRIYCRDLVPQSSKETDA